MRVSLVELEAAIRASWGPDTCHTPEQWSPDLPERAQCGTTAMVVQDLLGGDLVEAKVYRNGQHVEYHYWTRLPSGVDVDFTGAQFGDGFEVGEPEVRPRNKPMPPQHEAQYLTLAARVKDRLHLDGYMPMPPGPAV